MAGVQMMPAAVDVAGLRKAGGSGVTTTTSLFAGDWRRRRAPRRPSCSVRALRQGRRSSRSGLGIACNLAGQYEDSFEDVQLQLMNYFTYKAVRTVLTQLYEMNPPSYRWFYNFVAVNKPTDGKMFLRALSKERQELAERVMITRLHLYGKWIKKCDHGKMYDKISDENLALMRERLMETVIWPTDDTNTEKIG
ncbi:hypothetical protein HU200_003122 [Digitaria exilis]|uniref:Chaperonin-like RbcX protein n=1 Tax=Digitaria exilis TaxID=1010633 RepID=A0A835FX85_9POAL|nr:hypothetical protein HU200_003122 [Digitaria exilis]CAB3497767.1 unnamed protein product [Digitaria exilis]